MNKRFLPVGALVASAIVLLSGCSGSTGSADPAPTASDGELRKVTVAALPLVDIAPLWAGVEAGIFEEHGLDVDVTAFRAQLRRLFGPPAA